MDLELFHILSFPNIAIKHTNKFETNTSDES
jgi:hypothetical protein